MGLTLARAPRRPELVLDCSGLAPLPRARASSRTGAQPPLAPTPNGWRPQKRAQLSALRLFHRALADASLRGRPECKEVLLLATRVTRGLFARLVPPPLRRQQTSTAAATDAGAGAEDGATRRLAFEEDEGGGAEAEGAAAAGGEAEARAARAKDAAASMLFVDLLFWSSAREVEAMREDYHLNDTWATGRGARWAGGLRAAERLDPPVRLAVDGSKRLCFQICPGHLLGPGPHPNNWPCTHRVQARRASMPPNTNCQPHRLTLGATGKHGGGSGARGRSEGVPGFGGAGWGDADREGEEDGEDSGGSGGGAAAAAGEEGRLGAGAHAARAPRQRKALAPLLNPAGEEKLKRLFEGMCADKNNLERLTAGGQFVFAQAEL